MTSTHPVEQKLTRIYSERRKREVLFRVWYSVEEKSGCKVYNLERLEELE